MGTTRSSFIRARFRSALLHTLVGLVFLVFLVGLTWWLSPPTWGITPVLGMGGGFVVLCLVLWAGARRAVRPYEEELAQAADLWTAQGAQAVEALASIRRVLQTIPGSLGASGAPGDEVAAVEHLVQGAVDQAARLRAVEGNQGGLVTLLESSPQLTELLEAHLVQTNKTTEAAALSIMEELSTLNRDVSRQLMTLDDTTAKAGELYAESLKKVADNQALIATLHEYQRSLDRQIDSTIHVLSVEVEGLKPFTELIREVNAKTNILAINAAIEASRAGSAGKGFGVVAAEVRQLSTQVALAADKIEASVTQISQIVTDRMQTLSALIAADDESSGFATLLTTLPQVSQDFHATVESFAAFSKATRSDVEGIRSSILRMIGFAQFQDITRQQLEQVIHGLEKMKLLFIGVSQDLEQHPESVLAIPTMAAITNELRERYTMMLQRDTHDDVLGEGEGDSSEVRPPIELF